MTPDELSELVSDLQPLAPHAEYLRAIARPSVDIRLDARPGDDDKSRFGGSPYVPPDFVWPTHEQGVYRFLGQINFADIAAPPPVLPASGLLSLFYAAPNDSVISEEEFEELSDEEMDALVEEGDVEIFWQDPGYVVGYYWRNCDGFDLRRGTVAWRIAERFDPRQADVRESKNTAISLTVGVDLPRDRVLRDDWPFDQEVTDRLSPELCRFGKASQGHLLGYPSFSVLAYDPTPGENWLPLLTVDSVLDWCWHDGDKLMVFTEKGDLAKRDFSQLKCDAG
jgi:uncharacterized protein YwqG